MKIYAGVHVHLQKDGHHLAYNYVIADFVYNDHKWPCNKTTQVHTLLIN